MRTVGLKRTFSKGDETNWSYDLYEVTEIINDTTASDRLDNLPERYNVAILKNTELTMKEKKGCNEKIKYQKRSCIITPIQNF